MPTWNNKIPVQIQNMGNLKIVIVRFGGIENKVIKHQLINKIPDKLKFKPGCSLKEINNIEIRRLQRMNNGIVKRISFLT